MRVLLVVGCVLTVLSVAGCAQPQEASTTLPTAPSTTSASAEPTLEPLGPAELPVPDEARVQTLDGAIAMATYYQELIDYSRVIPAGEPLRDLSSGCRQCDELADAFDDAAVTGLTFVGGELEVSSSGGQLSDTAVADIAFAIQQEPMQVVDQAGEVLVDRGSPGGQLNGGTFLRWDSGRSVWITTQLDVELQR